MGDAVIVPPPASRTPHSLLPLLPRLLTRRRRGWPGLAALLAETGLSRPAFFLIRDVVERGPAGGTVESLRPGAPYATRDTHLVALAEAATAGFLVCGEGGRYRPEARGLALIARAEREATAWLATLRPLPDDELRRLADQLSGLGAGCIVDPADPDAHLARSRRMAELAPEGDAIPLVRIERAIRDLWMARDDAHIAAWRQARFPGPALDVLTHLWRGDADSLPALHERLAPAHDPATVEALVDDLLEQGYVEWRRGELGPTRAGYEVREYIESDTDERYFAGWPPLDPAAVARLYDTLRRLIDALPAAPPAR